ncbi:MAG: hypothetical protein IPJ86_06440 [Bacteroidetes bacterium]|nr:hypothetical protein [Bacteroidota bacterium]
MFLVKDKSVDRESRILKFVENDPALAIIMATIHFEWTIQRAIISLSILPNKEVRRNLKMVYGIKKYKDCWKELISDVLFLPKLPTIVKEWNAVIKAFELRNQLVHGKTSCSIRFATPRVKSLIDAARLIRIFCENQSINLDSKLTSKKSRITKEPYHNRTFAIGGISCSADNSTFLENGIFE